MLRGTGTPRWGWHKDAGAGWAEGQGHTHPVLAASFFEGAQQHGSVAALLKVGGHVLPGNAGCPALVGARHRVPGTLVLVVLGIESGQLSAGAESRRSKGPRGPRLTWMVSKTNSLAQ